MCSEAEHAAVFFRVLLSVLHSKGVRVDGQGTQVEDLLLPGRHAPKCSVPSVEG